MARVGRRLVRDFRATLLRLRTKALPWKAGGIAKPTRDKGSIADRRRAAGIRTPSDGGSS